MPNIKSAKKRVLVNEKKNNENRIQISAVKTAIKKINYAIDTNNMEEAERLLPETYAILDKAVSKGLMHKNTAANKKSGIAKRIADIKAGKKEVVIKKDNKTIAAEKAKAAQAAREAQRAEVAKKNAEKKAAAEAAKAAAAEEAKKAAKKTTAKKTTTKKAKKDEE
ncbi:MAG: 30S ribosomal protein S20 [Clostridia bacterium]|nr:30S ribosomal protein S20 [Clostridia bacterium]MBR7140536.1 30S ribosomal protein S20 [Clostridia bacterium]